MIHDIDRRSSIGHLGGFRSIQSSKVEAILTFNEVVPPYQHVARWNAIDQQVNDGCGVLRCLMVRVMHNRRPRTSISVPGGLPFHWCFLLDTQQHAYDEDPVSPSRLD